LDRKRRRIVFGAAAALLAVVSMILPQQASAQSGAAEPKMVKKSFTIEVPTGGTQILPANAGNSVNAGPPGGPCYYGNISGNIEAWYLEGILEHTDTFFNASIECQTTDPTQNMTRLTSIAKLYHYRDLKAEDVSECVHVLVTDPSCTAVYNWGYYQCWGQLNCAGEWSAADNQALVLPPGWVWGPPTDPACSLSGGSRELLCIEQTGTAIVSPTI
jgi:hypothetical protein